MTEIPLGSGKFEIKEPPGKLPSYYRLYKESNRANYIKGAILEASPPAIIPGTVIPGIDDDGVPQPTYTLKQAASIDITIEPGRYCIIPSMYMRTVRIKVLYFSKDIKVTTLYIGQSHWKNKFGEILGFRLC